MLCTLLATLTLSACGGGAENGRPSPRGRPLPNQPLEVYRRQGLITGSEEFAAVAGFATLAGPADSTWVLFGLSLPSAALRFHRDGSGFTAGYSVRLRFLRDGVERTSSSHSAQVRVGSFQETGRTEESIFYQDRVLLESGRYVVEVAIADSIGRRRLDAVDTIDVPSSAGDVPPALLLVHDAEPRASRATPPVVILNSRRSAAFGGETPRVYVESYDSVAPILELRVSDAAGEAVLVLPLTTAAAASGSGLRTATLALPIDSLPLGSLGMAVRDPQSGLSGPPATLLVTISDQWMVANYEEVLDYLVYIASSDEIERLRSAVTPAERRAVWEEFWTRRDPVPASPVNEYREEFFERVRVAAEQFAEIGRPGWRTDRGEVYIVLGAPDRVAHGELDARDISGAFDAIEWTYERGSTGGRMVLLFLDREGFGRYEMTRNSELTFRSIAGRLRVPSD